MYAALNWLLTTSMKNRAFARSTGSDGRSPDSGNNSATSWTIALKTAHENLDILTREFCLHRLANLRTLWRWLVCGNVRSAISYRRHLTSRVDLASLSLIGWRNGSSWTTCGYLTLNVRPHVVSDIPDSIRTTRVYRKEQAHGACTLPWLQRAQSRPEAAANSLALYRTHPTWTAHSNAVRRQLDRVHEPICAMRDIQRTILTEFV
jgi:hypothetical protein